MLHLSTYQSSESKFNLYVRHTTVCVDRCSTRGDASSPVQQLWHNTVQQWVDCFRTTRQPSLHLAQKKTGRYHRSSIRNEPCLPMDFCTMSYIAYLFLLCLFFNAFGSISHNHGSLSPTTILAVERCRCRKGQEKEGKKKKKKEMKRVKQ